MSVVLISCSKKKQEDEDVLMRFGDKTITYGEVIEMIPDGIHSADSAALFRSLLDSWLRDVVLSDFAEERLYDTEAIDRRVKDYRNNLIVLEYLNRMRETQNPKIEESRIKEYYDLHKKEIKLETPLVRGVFLKINSDITGKDVLKKLLTSDNPEDIDKLERDWLDRALQYNYFRDKWIDWETIKGMIPYRFGDPDNFLTETKFFTTDYDDCSYYLAVTDWLKSGEAQPYEYARRWITDVLTQGELAEYERVLVKSLIEKSLKEKKLEIVGYDPIKHELLQENVKNKDE